MRLEQFKDDAGNHVRLVGDDGEELMVSEAFDSKTNANRAADKLHKALGVRVVQTKE